MATSRRPGPIGLDPFSSPPVHDAPGPLGLGELVADRSGRVPAKAKGPKAEKTPTPARGRLVVLVAGGFDGFKSDAEEAEFLTKLDADEIMGRWYPHTKDFLQTAQDTQKGVRPWEVKNAGSVLGALQSEKGPIARVIYIGHGMSSGLGLSAAPGRPFTGQFTEMLTKDELNEDRWKGVIAEIRSKFAGGATFDIYACNVAVGSQFAKTLANAFRVRVRSFKGEIWWCVGHDAKKKTITSRGRMALQNGPHPCSNEHWRSGTLNWIPPEVVDPDP